MNGPLHCSGLPPSASTSRRSSPSCTSSFSFRSCSPFPELLQYSWWIESGIGRIGQWVNCPAALPSHHAWHNPVGDIPLNPEDDFLYLPSFQHFEKWYGNCVSPGMNPAATVQARPRLVFWELTTGCNLSCIHCRASATELMSPDDLSTSECLRIVDELAQYAPLILVLSGGEPPTAR